jgi:hypothetical protein
MMIYHMSMSIEGAILNAKTLKGCITVDGHTLETVGEIRNFMRSELAKGRRVLPLSKCSNFCYQTGCKGHEKNEAWFELKRIGLNNPTEVEYNEKSLVTVGLDIETLVKTWRDTFNLQEHDIYLETTKEQIEQLSKSVAGEKTVKELFEEQRVFLREVE